MRNYIVLILSAALFAACSQSPKLESDRLVQQHFTTEEIKDLNVLLNFFETEISAGKELKEEELQKAYADFLKKGEAWEATGFYEPFVSIEKQQELYEKISPESFNNIWVRGTEIKRRNSKKDTVPYLYPAFDGKYTAFMKDLAKEDKFIEEYYSHFEAVRDISPVNIAMIIQRYDQLNIEDIRVRLFIVIHFITINDQYKPDKE